MEGSKRLTTGKDIEKYPQGEHDKQDAFLVIEEETVNGRQYSIGGLSQDK